MIGLVLKAWITMSDYFKGPCFSVVRVCRREVPTYRSMWLDGDESPLTSCVWHVAMIADGT